MSEATDVRAMNAALTATYAAIDNGRVDQARVIAAAPALLAALEEIAAMTDEDAGTFRKRGGTYRGLVGIIARDALAKVRGEA